MALEDLVGCYERLMNQLYQALLEACSENDRQAIIRQAKSLDNEMLDPSVRALVGSLANDSTESINEWVQGIATVISRKAPQEWTDEDVTRFRRQLPEHIGAFQRLVTLYAELPLEYECGLTREAFRVTISRLDGTEHVGLIAVSHSQRDLVESIIEKSVSELDSLMESPNRARRVLLAVLGAQVFSEQTSINDTGPMMKESSDA